MPPATRNHFSPRGMCNALSGGVGGVQRRSCSEAEGAELSPRRLRRGGKFGDRGYPGRAERDPRGTPTTPARNTNDHPPEKVGGSAP
jgi:hypothetical protein